MEAFLLALLPRVLPENCSFRVHPFKSKQDLLRKLVKRLRGYHRWLPPDWRIVVLVDRDLQDCQELKVELEDTALSSRLPTRSRPGGDAWRVVNRVVIEELEAWYFGDWEAVQAAYPRVSPRIPRQAPYRDPDAIRGGTWEAFERILQRHRYYKGGLKKVEAARTIGEHIGPARNCSRSFTVFFDVLVEAVGGPS